MIYSIQKIIFLVHGELLNPRLFDSDIERLLFDSRHLVFPNRTLFFAFKSKRQDGHNFIPELYQQGVRNYMITKKLDTTKYPNGNFILVKNSIDALQQLVTFHRNQFSLPVIGITGSNGKTIIKEWLFQLLQANYNIIRSPTSYNSQIGVPLSVWQIEKQHNLGVFEGGISQVGEMEKIAPIINCDVGIFTNIGEAHREGFSSKKEKLLEKIKLFEQAKTIIYCRDNDLVDSIFKKFDPNRLFSWSHNKRANLQILGVEKKENTSAIKATFQSKNFTFFIPFTDNASVENAIHCCAVMLFLGISFEIIQKRMLQLVPISMRLELKEGINNCTIINDSYNSDLTSLELALNYAEKRSASKKLVLILSDILQSGLKPTVLYHKVAQLIIAKKVNHLIAIGKEIAIIQKFLPPNFGVSFYKNTGTFLARFTRNFFNNNTILLKGARIFKFEKIVNRFEEKAHKVVLEVDLSAIVHNLKIYGKQLKSNTKLMAMVKASAYGSGSVEVAKILAFYKVDYLAVAYTDEGVELRKAGIQLPIMVLNPEEASFETLIRYNLEPEIYSIDLLKQLLDFIPDVQPISIHLKLDTGMHRLGFEKEDISSLLGLLQKNPQINIKSIFSHLAASNMEEHDEFTQLQFNLFIELYEGICKNLNYRPTRHILNSSGTHRFPQYQLDMVRLGSGLYGIDSSGIIQQQLKVVNRLKATISQIKYVDKKETIGYNRSGKINQPKKIGTINIGYADGLSRKTGNGKYAVSVQGQKVPIIGNVCMDMCMIDLTHISDAKIGEEVIIFGDSPSVIDLADCVETIPYEIFTSISSRVKRIYFRS